MRAMKSAVAGFATKYYPAILAYAAQAQARGATRLCVEADHIDIVRRRDSATIRLAKTNAVYAVDMMNAFDYYFGSIQPKSARNSRGVFDLVDFSKPAHHHVTGFDDFPILCPSLAEPYVTTQQYLDIARLLPGHVVLDLGAYSGLTTIAFSKAVGATGRVIALEPDPNNFAAADANIAAHRSASGLDNVTLVQAAVSGAPGELVLSAEGAMGSADVSLVGGYRGKTICVPALTIEGISQSQHLARIDFVKMDIEGSEAPALAAAQNILRRFRPILVVEPHVVNSVRSDAKVQSALESCGYRCETIAQTGVTLPLIIARPID